MRYNVGDKVLLKRSLRVGKPLLEVGMGALFVNSMEDYKNKPLTIKKLASNLGTPCYVAGKDRWYIADGLIDHERTEKLNARKNLEWIEKEIEGRIRSAGLGVNHSRPNVLVHHEGFIEGMTEAKAMVGQVGKLGLPTIPECVASEIRGYGDDSVDVILSSMVKKARRGFDDNYTWIANNIAVLADAVRYGYNIEERKYKVFLRGANGEVMFLFKDDVGEVREGVDEDDFQESWNRGLELTEKEIKSFGKWYWHFAEETKNN